MGTENQLPDVDTAYGNIYAGVHNRIFVEKMAAAGYNPRSEADLEEMLKVAAALRERHEAEMSKQASEGSSPYAAATQHLDALLGRQGTPNLAQERSIKQASVELARDPVFFNSVLAIKAAQAAEVKQQLLARQG